MLAGDCTAGKLGVFVPARQRLLEFLSSTCSPSESHPPRHLLPAGQPQPPPDFWGCGDLEACSDRVCPRAPPSEPQEGRMPCSWCSRGFCGSPCGRLPDSAKCRRPHLPGAFSGPRPPPFTAHHGEFPRTSTKTGTHRNYLKKRHTFFSILTRPKISRI